MIERGASVVDIMNWKTMKCGLTGNKCLLDYHQQNADKSLASFNRTIANWLVAVSEYQYLGIGGGWSGAGPSACATWLREYPEYSKPLGEPKSDALIMNNTVGLKCTLLD